MVPRKLLLKIDKALYEADEVTRTYRYFGRNPDWENLSEEKNRQNKKRLDGFTRIFPDGRKKVFRYTE